MDDSRGVEESLAETVCVNDTCAGLTVYMNNQLRKLCVFCPGQLLIHT